MKITETEEKETKTVPRGLPKSGRIWKSQKTKFSTNTKSKGLKSSFENKEKLRKDLLAIKELSRSIKAAKEEEQKMKKERRKENLKKQEENRKKSEVVQVITNTAKIKKMKKKHLRQIEKRDTTNM
ncbi:coiled-coil domain-containing protein 86 [Harmonia axyridis]|uniref:coiled-coil domain-containing protein 86 n=1 Tax=Harmonia axyridis TaxID=115357 RepID=UPI001E276054|nr:coiled-coil domain-containing protein 86 [Harmonia axyridis]